MNCVILTYILMLLVLSVVAYAEDPLDIESFYPILPDPVYREDAAQSQELFKSTWKFYAWLEDIKNKAKLEYHHENFDTSFYLDFEDRKPSAVCRIRLFGRPVFLEFRVQE